MIETLKGKDFVLGLVKLFLVNQLTGARQLLHEFENLYLYSGADIAARLVGGQSTYRLATMYMEFENMVGPGPIVPPAYTRASGIDYYSTLAAPRDFLRVPITLSPTIISSDAAKFEGNQITFFAVSSGSVGQHALPFSHTVNSAVFGGALVASPDADTQANDKIWSRTYWEDRFVLKQQNHQIGVQWTLRFL